MKVKILLLFMIICFIFPLYLFGKITIKLISLKFENEKVTGIITNIQKTGYKNRNLKIEYNYKYMEVVNNKKSTISSSILMKLFTKKIFSNYYIGQNINILVKRDNTYSFIEKEINSEISIYLIYILLVLLMEIYFIRILLNINTKKISNNKMLKSNIKYYVQNNNYKIINKNIGDNITIDIINNLINYNALINNEIICCGIEKGNDFVEITFIENKFNLRVYKNGKEKIEFVEDYLIINEIIYEYIRNGNCA
jgi:hypothetical protein